MAAGNSTLASLIQGLSGGMLRARLWRSSTEERTVEVTNKRHLDIYGALRARDPELASAADLVHLSDGARRLRRVVEKEQALESQVSGRLTSRDASAPGRRRWTAPARNTRSIALLLDSPADEPAHERALRDNEHDRHRHHCEERREGELRAEDVDGLAAAAGSRVEGRRR